MGCSMKGALFEQGAKECGELIEEGLIEEGHFLKRGLSRLEVLNGGDYRGGGLIRNSKF